MHSSRMHTACSLPHGASLSGGPPCTDTPGRDPPGQRPQTETPLAETWDQRQRPAWEGIWDQAVRQEVTLYRDPLPSMDRMTDMCKNITLPQTSFAGGKYVIFIFSFFRQRLTSTCLSVSTRPF